MQAAFTEALSGAFTAAPIAERRCAEAYIAEVIGASESVLAPQPLERLPSAPQQQTPIAMAIVSVDIFPIPPASNCLPDHDGTPALTRRRDSAIRGPQDAPNLNQTRVLSVQWSDTGLGG